MFKHGSFALLFAALGIFLASLLEPYVPPYQGRNNNTVLILGNQGLGLSNVHLATAMSLVEKHPDIQVPFASFPHIRKKVSTLSAAAKARAAPGSGARDIIFHELSGTTLYDSVRARNLHFDLYSHAPGLVGLNIW